MMNADNMEMRQSSEDDTFEETLEELLQAVVILLRQISIKSRASISNASVRQEVEKLQEEYTLVVRQRAFIAAEVSRLRTHQAIQDGRRQLEHFDFSETHIPHSAGRDAGGDYGKEESVQRGVARKASLDYNVGQRGDPSSPHSERDKKEKEVRLLGTSSYGEHPGRPGRLTPAHLEPRIIETNMRTINNNNNNDINDNNVTERRSDSTRGFVIPAGLPCFRDTIGKDRVVYQEIHRFIEAFEATVTATGLRIDHH